MDRSRGELDHELERFRPDLNLLARANWNSHRPTKFDASDIVQQTMLDAVAKQDHFQGHSDGELAAWLRQIPKHNLADALRDQRRDKRDVRRERSLEADIDASFARTHEWLAAVQSSPSQRAVRNEDVLRLSSVMSDCPKLSARRLCCIIGMA